jgi:hypothetical protein
MRKVNAATQESSPPSPRAAAVLEQISAAKDTAQSIEKALRETAPLLDETAVRLVSHKAFQAALRDKPPLKDLVSLFSLVLKFKQQALAERRFELLKARAPGKDPKGLTLRHDGGYSEEQLQQIQEMINLL